MDDQEDRWFNSNSPGNIRTSVFPDGRGFPLESLYGSSANPSTQLNPQLSEQLTELLRYHHPSSPDLQDHPSDLLLNLMGFRQGQHAGQHAGHDGQHAARHGGGLPDVAGYRHEVGAHPLEAPGSREALARQQQLQRMAELLHPTGFQAGPRSEQQAVLEQQPMHDMELLNRRQEQRRAMEGMLTGMLGHEDHNRQMMERMQQPNTQLALEDILRGGGGGGGGGSHIGAGHGAATPMGAPPPNNSAIPQSYSTALVTEAIRAAGLPNGINSRGPGGSTPATPAHPMTACSAQPSSVSLAAVQQQQQQQQQQHDMRSAALEAGAGGQHASDAILKAIKDMGPQEEVSWQQVQQVAHRLKMNADAHGMKDMASIYDSHGCSRPGLPARPTESAQTPSSGRAEDAAKASAPSAPNKHGRRINPRKGIPMHIMATYALLRLQDYEGNLSDMSAKIEENEYFCKQLDWTPRPGTKTYPRWKDALVGCFKPGRYPHLKKTNRKKEGLTVYALDEKNIPDKSCLKAHMLQDVDPAQLPSDFDIGNPLVPLHGANRHAVEKGLADKHEKTTSVVTTGNLMPAPGSYGGEGNAVGQGACDHLRANGMPVAVKHDSEATDRTVLLSNLLSSGNIDHNSLLAVLSQPRAG